MNFTFSSKRYDDVKRLDDDDYICYCIEVTKATIVKAICNGAHTLKDIRNATGACSGTECAVKNPNKRCCSKEINQLITLYRKDEA